MDYTSEGSWREVGPLPSPRIGLAGATVGGVFHVTGGCESDDCSYIDEVLAWDAVSEIWSLAGHTKGVRHKHAVTVVALDAMMTYCSRVY